jgi:anti-anti-sigma regulatory factor
MSAVPATKVTMGRVSVAVERTPAGDLLTLDGEMDDRATLSDLTDQLADNVIVDLGGVRFINSVGVREWILFLRALEDEGRRIVLRNCSEPMVHQMNMVVEARGPAEIESFYAPYLCETCAGEASIVLDVASHLPALKAQQMPTRPCPDCGGTMVFDDFPNRYLLFLE